MTDEQHQDELGVTVRTVWPADAGRGAAPANQFAVMAGAPLSDAVSTEGSVYVVIGHLAPPLLVAPEDVAAFNATTSGELVVDVKGAFVMTHARALELHKALAQHLGLEPRS